MFSSSPFLFPNPISLFIYQTRNHWREVLSAHNLLITTPPHQKKTPSISFSMYVSVTYQVQRIHPNVGSISGEFSPFFFSFLASGRQKETPPPICYPFHFSFETQPLGIVTLFSASKTPHVFHRDKTSTIGRGVKWSNHLRMHLLNPSGIFRQTPPPKK